MIVIHRTPRPPGGPAISTSVENGTLTAEQLDTALDVLIMARGGR